MAFVRVSCVSGAVCGSVRPALPGDGPARSALSTLRKLAKALKVPVGRRLEWETECLRGFPLRGAVVKAPSTLPTAIDAEAEGARDPVPRSAVHPFDVVRGAVGASVRRSPSATAHSPLL